MEIVMQKIIVQIETIFVTILNIILQSNSLELKSHHYEFFFFLILIRRDNWREQRPAGMNNNRRGGGNNSKQNQYASTNNRQQYNTRISRNNRFADNRSPHEGRESPLQQTNEESARNQRLNSGNFSQGQTSGPTSPSTTVPARTIYPSANRPSANRNSPAPYAGSSSSRNNSIPTTSPPLPHQQSGTNKMTKKPSLSKNQNIFSFYF